MEQSSGVGVLDKSVLVLEAVESGASTLAALVERTGLSRATRTGSPSRSRCTGCSAATARAAGASGRARPSSPAAAAATRCSSARRGVLARLRDVTGESAQLYRRQGDRRVCVAAAERGSGLRDTVPGGQRRCR